MTLRCTSLVPPAMVRQRVARNPCPHRCASALQRRPTGAVEGEAGLLDPLLVLHAEQLADAGSGTGVEPRQGPQGDPVPHQAQRLCLCEQRPHVDRGPGGAASPSRPSSPQHRFDPGRRTSMPLDIDDPLVGQGGAGRSANPDRAPDDARRRGRRRRLEEDLVEHGRAGELAQRPDVDTRANACRPRSR